jgi:RNA polymerase sigma-70 factor (ECF subfamily)
VDSVSTFVILVSSFPPRSTEKSLFLKKTERDEKNLQQKSRAGVIYPVTPFQKETSMFGTKQKKKAAWVQTALERYERPLLQYAMSIVGELERARDVVQETFMRLHNQEQENIEGHLSQWLFTVCRNCALKSLKKEDRYIYVEAQEFEQKRCEGLTPLMELERKERVERLMELVKELPKNQYEVVLLRFHHHHSYQEISEITGLSVGNVGFLLNAAMRNLRGKMDRDEKDEKIIYLKKGVA